MKVFISHSGDQSKAIADILYQWLKVSLQGLDLFVSTHDIRSGRAWFAEIENELEDTHYGLLVMTPENLVEPWIMFEAGALSKHKADAHIVAILFEVAVADLVGPLTSFQAVPFEPEKMRKLIGELNDAQKDRKLDPETFAAMMQDGYPTLEARVSAIPKTIAVPPLTPEERDERINEILVLVRKMTSEDNYPSDLEIALYEQQQLRQAAERKLASLKNILTRRSTKPNDGDPPILWLSDMVLLNIAELVEHPSSQDVQPTNPL